MSEKKVIWGIRMVPLAFEGDRGIPVRLSPDPQKALSELQGKRNQISVIRFETAIDCFQPSDNRSAIGFATNPWLQRYLKMRALEYPHSLGYFGVDVDQEKKEIMTTAVFPFKNRPGLQGHGLGSFVELQIQKILFSVFPTYSIRTAHLPESPRLRQILTRGWKPGKPKQFLEAIQSTQKQVVSRMKKYRLQGRPMAKKKRNGYPKHGK